MLRKAGLLVLLCLFSNAENIKIEKFSLNDIKKCLEPNEKLLCKNKHEKFIYRDLWYFESNKIPTCDNKFEKMYVFSQIIDSRTRPKIETTKSNNEITIKQNYETEILSSSKIGACKTNNEIIIKSENK